MYDPWTAESPILNSRKPAPVALDKETVAGWKPATVKGVRYETRNVRGGSVESRAFVADVPSLAPPKYEDTLYGRYTSALPKKLAEAESLATGGNLKAARAIMNEVNAWIDADEPRLMKHMAYRGQDRAAAEFAQVAKGAITRDWSADVKWQNLMNPATNPRIAQYEADVIGLPEGPLRDTYETARGGDPEAKATIAAFHRSAPGGALVQRSAAGARPTAAAADAPLADRKDDPEFATRVFQNAGTVIPSFFSADANKTRTQDQRMRDSWTFTGLTEAHPQVGGIVSKVMGGAQSADQTTQSALFEHTTRALSETAQAAGDLAPLAMTAAEEMVTANTGAQGVGFRAIAPKLQHDAVEVAQQVAAAQRSGFDVPDAAVRRLARMRSGTTNLSPADQTARDALGSFRSAYQALTADITLAQPPGVAEALGSTPASGKTPERVGGLDMLVGAIQDIAGGVAVASAGDATLTPAALHDKMLSQAPAVADVLLNFGGTVEVDGKPQQMTKEQALGASRLLLAYIAENPAVNITEAFTKMSQEMSVVPTDPSVPGGASSNADTRAASAPLTADATAITSALASAKQGESGPLQGEPEYDRPYRKLQPVLKRIWDQVTVEPTSGFRQAIERADVRRLVEARRAGRGNPEAQKYLLDIRQKAFEAMRGEIKAKGLQRYLPEEVWAPVADREFAKVVGRVGELRPTGAKADPQEYRTFGSGTVRDVYGVDGYTRWLASGTDVADRDLAWYPDRTIAAIAKTGVYSMFGFLDPVARGRAIRAGNESQGLTLSASDLLTEGLLSSITKRLPGDEGQAAAIHKFLRGPDTPSAPALTGPVTRTRYLDLATAGGNTVDPKQAVAAGQAVIKRITESVLTEATRARLYNEHVDQYYLRQGVPPSVLDKARQDAVGAFYRREIPENQTVQAFQFSLDTAVEKMRKAEAAAKAADEGGGGIAAASDTEE